MIRTYKYKLKLNKEQTERISSWIGACRWVYNTCLEIRIATYRCGQKRISKYDLINQLPTIKDVEWIKDVPAQSLQEAVVRLDKSYQNFFRTCHSGGGFPKFADRRKYHSILFRQITVIGNNIIRLPKIGELKMFKDRPVKGNPKTAQITKEPTGYFVCIQCENVQDSIQNPDESQVIGIDMGIARFCVDSNGVKTNNPETFKKYERQLRIENRSLARKKKGSHRWKKQAGKIARLHHRIANIRKDFLHKESTKYAKMYHTIYLENLKIKNMSKRAKNKQDEAGRYLPNGQSAKSGLNKAILDCGWGMYRNMLAYKTEVKKERPHFSSQECNACGCIDSENRHGRNFECKKCGHKDDADVNAAKNILSRGTAHTRQREEVSCA